MREGARCRRLSLAVFLALALTGCRERARSEEPTLPKRPIAQVLAERTPALMRIRGVVGTAEGASGGRPVILILVERATPELEARLPRTLDGWPVEIRETGKIKALGR